MKTTTIFIMLCAAVILAEGCKKKKEEPIFYYANADVNGVRHTFKTTHSFGKFCILTGVCNTFYANPEVTNQNYLMIGLPTTVRAGVTYTSDSSKTQLLYTDNAGHQYFSTWGDSLAITVTRWDGHGGTATGTFSGKLKYTTGTTGIDSVYITNGSFSAPIWYVVTK